MKKRMVNVLGVTAAVMLLVGCGAKADTPSTGESTGVRPKEEISSNVDQASSEEGSLSEESQTDASSTGEKTQSGGTLISEEEAKKIALKDAGFKEEEISGIRIKLETDDGVQEYEVDFYADNKEYDYDIDAVSGEIRSKDKDIDDDFKWDTSSSSSDAKISEAKAKKIALKKVSGATEKDIRIHLDKDDGRVIYEGSIVYNDREYDFEIDAVNGDILEWEEESIYD